MWMYVSIYIISAVNDMSDIYMYVRFTVHILTEVHMIIDFFVNLITPKLNTLIRLHLSMW